MMVFDEKQVLYVANQGKSQAWPYPKVFLALKEAGVTLHEVGVEEFRSTYKNGSQEWTEPLPNGFHPLTVENDFNEAAIHKALARRSRHETTYVEFLRDIAAAGVVHYQVDMASQTVRYRGRNEKDFFIQSIPPYTETI